MIPKPKILELYESGLSTRQISLETGWSKSYIHKICKGRIRTRSQAAILRQPPTTKHWRSCRASARKIWSKVNGNIPIGHHIHHKDGDFTNNNLSNLECLSAADHMRYHHAGPEYNIPRHLRSSRQKYMKAYLKEYNKTYVRKA